MTVQNTLWVIDDDPALRLILEDTFTDAGLDVRVFANAQGAWATLNDILGGHETKDILPDAILTDIRMPMMDGLSFSDWVHQHFPELPIIIMTAHSDLRSAVDSYQTGAFDYLPKPFDLDEAVTIIEKAIKPKTQSTSVTDDSTEIQVVQDAITTPNDEAITPADANNSKNATNKNTTSKNATRFKKTNKPVAKPDVIKTAQQSSGIIGQSVAMQTVFRAIGRLAKSPITVLITGESGTGKELVAHALHQHSPRQKKSFIALNMAALPHDLIESELFGHEKGAFTGATTQRQGRFEQASGGTLFLDEIGDMPFSTQTRLLRVLANGEFFRVGGHKPIKVDVRIIAATHQDLETLVKQGKFREDLFYRLNVIRLPLPPLRARREDIPALVDFFMQRAATELNSEEKIVSSDAMQLMQAFDWRGNVRQLENACRWITVMATGDVVFVEDLPPELTEFAHQLHNNQNKPQASNAMVAGAGDPSANMPTSSSNSPHINGLSSSVQHNVGYRTSYDETFNSTSGQSPIDNLAQQQQQGMPPASTQHNNHSNPQSRHNIAENNKSQIADNTLVTNSTDKPTSISNATVAPQPLPVSSKYFDSLKPQLTWQEQLKTWADKALYDGRDDILQVAASECERLLIDIALTHTKGRKGEAAELLGWGRNTLTRKLKQL